jgi:hypothetical protein
MNNLPRLAGIAALLLLLQPAQAALITSVSFTERTGTVQPDEIVEVWVTLTVDSQSDPLYINHLASAPYFGLSPEVVPTNGYISSPDYDPALFPFSDWQRVSGSYGYNPCPDGGFLAACGGDGSYTHAPSNYIQKEDTFRWATTYIAYEPAGYPNQTFLLNPGESRDFLMFAFQPLDGLAEAGTYQLNTVVLDLVFTGWDASGNQINGNYRLGNTCPTGATDCAFIRSVVPIPAAVWLFGSGLGLLGWVRRRRPS